jgi:polysaccharide deacetylase 2 family uncharacterized protein YibQ
VAADDLDAPLGKKAAKKRKLTVPALVPQAVAGLLACAVLGFAGWTLVVDDPLGGEPMAVAIAEPKPDGKKADNPMLATGSPPPGARRYDGPDSTAAPAAAEPAKSGRTINIIDGSSGKTQQVVLGAPDDSKRAPVDTRLLDQSRHGAIPKIAPDGARPSEVYARAPQPGKNPDGPRIAVIISGLGVGATGTSEALAKLPGPVTLAFTPYGSDLENLVGRARADGHEVLLQVPMEPFDYPDNDPGPQTLLTSLSPEQNVDRLHWLFSRFQGYVGITNFMGARFTASEPAISPVLREAAKRGLVYVDDGSSPRSLAGQIAGANRLPYAKADVVIDAAPAPAEIDKALARAEAMAKERGLVTVTGSALPVTIDRVSKWAKAAQGRGINFVPITAAAIKPKSS